MTQPIPMTWVDVDLAAIQQNVRQLRRLLRPTTQLMAIIKANAYGHGLLHVAEALSGAFGRPRLADAFGVAMLTEGIALRNHGVTMPILILGPIAPAEAPLVAQHSLTPTIYTRPVALALARAAQRAREPVRVHVKVDTGMGRYGVWHADAQSFVQWVRRQPGLLMEGLYTHLASAVQDRAATAQQLARFQQLIAALERAGCYVPLKHAANSMGLLGYQESHWDMVRVGLALYGLCPKSGWRPPVPLTPALRWQARVGFVKTVTAGRTISYGGTYRVSRRTQVATIPVGYALGYPLRGSNRAAVLAHGRRAPVVGRVTMDHLMIECGSRTPVRAGDPVTLLGGDGRLRIRAEELARWAGTIAYDVLCGINPAVPRCYLPTPAGSSVKTQASQISR